MIQSEAGEGAKKVPKQKLQEIVMMMMRDVAATEKPLVGEQIGGYNRKFAEKWGRELVKRFGANAN